MQWSSLFLAGNSQKRNMIYINAMQVLVTQCFREPRRVIINLLYVPFSHSGFEKMKIPSASHFVQLETISKKNLSQACKAVLWYVRLGIFVSSVGFNNHVREHSHQLQACLHDTPGKYKELFLRAMNYLLKK